MSAFAEDKESDYGTVKKVRLARARACATSQAKEHSNVQFSTSRKPTNRARMTPAASSFAQLSNPAPKNFRRPFAPIALASSVTPSDVVHSSSVVSENAHDAQRDMRTARHAV